jgi:sigma-B regulation protein RsbU (phosphoserine phosphatase)
MALFDLESRNVTVCRAGHNPMLIYSNGLIKPLKSNGMGLGVGSLEQFSDALEEITMPLNKDEFFVLYSDGLSEAMNKAKELYGISRISSIIESDLENSSEVLKNDILNSIESFREDSEQYDDETVVVVKVK